MSIVFSFSWELKWPHKKLKTMLMQNFEVTNKDCYGMLWYFPEWSVIAILSVDARDYYLRLKRGLYLAYVVL